MLTEKENLLMTYRGETPEWVPVLSGESKPPERYLPLVQFRPSLLRQHQERGGGPDIWGVNYIPTESADNAIIPDNSHYILSLDNLKNWRDIIKAPDFSGVDWEKQVKNQIESSGIDRDQTAISLSLHFGYFQLLMSFMGFEHGLLAFYEDPDSVHELLDYVSDFYMSVADNVIDLFKPEILYILDDTASWNAPFISTDMYREFLVPYHNKYIKRGLDRGLILAAHNCGKCESLLDLFFEMGFSVWDPAQTCNDLKAIKAKYGGRLTFEGGWDSFAYVDSSVTEGQLRQSVRDTMDAYAPGGGYCWRGSFLGAVNDAETAAKNAIILNEALKYGRGFYKR